MEHKQMQFKHRIALQAAIAIAAAVAAVGSANACSTLVIGKNVSKTGNIILAHNEDNGGRLFNLQHYVPPATHKPGEMIKFEPKAAAIPQVEKTLGFYWTQTLVPDGASFADGFFNDAGVAIASNWCGEIFEADKMPVKDGGIGYGIRRLVAERAHSAREGVDIAIKLLNEYGYFHEGRTYTIADAKEAWQIAIHQGNSWAAHKIQDDEVVYIPNAFSMDKVDLKDRVNWLIEKGQVERADKDGRHDPKDRYFNWRKIVAPASIRAERWNANRNVIAWKFLTGHEYSDPETFPYSVKLNRKLGVADAMALLRQHESYIGEEQELYHSASEGICRTTTHDSIVYNLTADPMLTEAWKTLDRPCQSVYIPLYPLAAPAEGTSFLTPETATADHFAGKAADFDYRADFAPYSVFCTGTNAIDYLRGDEIAKRTALIGKLESKFLKERPAVTKKAASLKGEARAKYLHAYNQKVYDEVAKVMKAENARLMPMKVQIVEKTVIADSDAPVTIALIASKDRPVKNAVKMKATRAGMSANQLNSTRQFKNFAAAQSMEYKDVNGDGIEDVVFTFKGKDLAKGAVPGARMDLWLYTQVNGHRVTGYDVVPVGSSKVAAPLPIESRSTKNSL